MCPSINYLVGHLVFHLVDRLWVRRSRAAYNNTFSLPQLGSTREAGMCILIILILEKKRTSKIGDSLHLHVKNQSGIIGNETGITYILQKTNHYSETNFILWEICITTFKSMQFIR